MVGKEGEARETADGLRCGWAQVAAAKSVWTYVCMQVCVCMCVWTYVCMCVLPMQPCIHVLLREGC